jgi:hypothetical protein
MMRAGFRLRMDDHGASPQFFGARSRVVDRRGAVHAGRLRGVHVELICPHDAHAVVPPFRFVRVRHRDHPRHLRYAIA